MLGGSWEMCSGNFIQFESTQERSEWFREHWDSIYDPHRIIGPGNDPESERLGREQLREWKRKIDDEREAQEASELKLAGCVHHGDKVIENGKTLTRGCSSCGDGLLSRQVVFHCNARNRDLIISDCAICVLEP